MSSSPRLETIIILKLKTNLNSALTSVTQRPTMKPIEARAHHHIVKRISTCAHRTHPHLCSGANIGAGAQGIPLLVYIIVY